MILQVVELAEWALEATPSTHLLQQVQHAAPHVLTLLHTAFRALACSHGAVLGEALRLTRGLFEDHGKGARRKSGGPKFRGALWSYDLSEHIESLTLEHVVPPLLAPASNYDPVQVRHPFYPLWVRTPARGSSF